jgi:hypothetical protein
MKTRSSSGVGQKVDLEFDIESLRIRDLGEDEEYQQFKKQSSSIYSQIKSKSMMNNDEGEATVEDEPGKIVADVQSTKLKQMLGALKTNG